MDHHRRLILPLVGAFVLWPAVSSGAEAQAPDEAGTAAPSGASPDANADDAPSSAPVETSDGDAATTSTAASTTATVTSVAPAAIPAPAAEWLSTLYDHTRNSVVLIRTDDGGVGSGFLFHSARHVATAYHVVENAEVIGVTVPGFQPMRGTVVAWDRNIDLAIVELPGDIPDAHVLSPSTRAPHIGMDVAVIGHPYSQYAQMLDELHGLLDWTLTAGIVGGMSEAWIQIDAAVNPGNSGGPILDRDGNVVGVVSARLNQAEGIGFGARIETLVNLASMIGMDEPPMNNVDRDKLELLFMVHWDQNTLNGFAFGGGLVFYRRFPLRLRLGFLSGGGEIVRSDVIRRDLNRYAIEIEGGYHLPLLTGMTLSLLAGAAIDVDEVEETRAFAVDDGTCMAASCTYPTGITIDKQTDVRARFQVGLSATLFIMRLSYAFQMNFDQFDRSVHRFYIGAAF